MLVLKLYKSNFLCTWGNLKEKLLQNVLLFCFIKYGSPANTHVYNLLSTERTLQLWLACSIAKSYLQTTQTGSYLYMAFVTDKCIASYGKSEIYNDHPTYYDKIIIFINVILTKFVYQNCITVRLGNIPKSYYSST